MGFLYLIVLILWIVAIEYLYHKVFTVYYFSLGEGLKKEIVTSCFLGLLMTGLTFYLWWLTALIIIIFGIINMSKTGNKMHIIIAVVLAIVVAILGLTVRISSTDEDTNYSYEQVIQDNFSELI